MSPLDPEPVLVLMLPDHYRAYCDWLDGFKLKTGRISPYDATVGNLPIYIVTPAYNHPAGKRKP